MIVHNNLQKCQMVIFPLTNLPNRIFPANKVARS
jgi:hypothetical protein